MSNSYQNEIPKARVNIRLDLHACGAQKKFCQLRRQLDKFPKISFKYHCAFRKNINLPAFIRDVS